MKREKKTEEKLPGQEGLVKIKSALHQRLLQFLFGDLEMHELAARCLLADARTHTVNASFFEIPCIRPH